MYNCTNTNIPTSMSYVSVSKEGTEVKNVQLANNLNWAALA